MRGNKKSWIVLILIAAVLFPLLFVSCAASVAGTQDAASTNHSSAASQSIAEETSVAVETNRRTEPSSLMNHTKWLSDDGSELVFTDERINWYRSMDDHNDNFYSGTFQFYIGQDAIQYLTQSLSEYEVTEADLQALFDRSSEYDQSSFVVFDIRYDQYVVNGTEQVITRNLVPWYGFLLKDGTFLDVANMNTGSYYPFIKQTE